jgi:hypothetical protein
MEENTLQKEAILWNDKYRIYRSFRQIFLVKQSNQIVDEYNVPQLDENGNAQIEWKCIAVIELKKDCYELRMVGLDSRISFRFINEICGYFSKDIFTKEVLDRIEANLVLERLMRGKK